MRKQTINIRIPLEQYILIDSEANKQGITKTELLRKTKMVFFK